MCVHCSSYVDELDSYSNVADMVQVELIAACILKKEKVNVLLRQQGQEGWLDTQKDELYLIQNVY